MHDNKPECDLCDYAMMQKVYFKNVVHDEYYKYDMVKCLCLDRMFYFIDGYMSLN